MNTNWRLGLVELHVDLPQKPATDLPTLMRGAILNHGKRREQLVRSVLLSSEPELQTLDALVFPGWTLVGEQLPAWVPEACGTRVVSIEVTWPDKHGKSVKKSGGDPSVDLAWATYVVADGAVVVGDVEQLVAVAGDVPDWGADVVSQLANVARPYRSFLHQRIGKVGLLVCGEVNIAPGNPPRPLRGFPNDLRLILNPAHTPSTLPAMRLKRQRLSRGAVLATTANTHGAWKCRPKGTRDTLSSRSSRTVSAELYRRETSLPRSAGKEIVVQPGATVVIHEVTAPA